jgi:hypothetical protein
LNTTATTNGLTLAGNQTLQGAGTIAGNVTAMSTSIIHPGQGLPLTFNTNLTYTGAGATNIFNLTSSTSSGNDQIVLNGNNSTLACGNAQIVINSAGTLATSDYVLFNLTGTGSTISGSFNPTPAFIGTVPANAAHYSVVGAGSQVLLHYSAVVPVPVFTSASISGGTNLVVNGTNGVAGNYILLTSTNVGSTNWTRVSTNAVGASGPFSFVATNAVTPGAAQQFYILQVP